MTFVTTPAIGGGVLVEGTDSKGVDGQTILRSEKYDQLLELRALKEAQTEFEGEVDKVFGPIIAAAEKFEASTAKPRTGYFVTVVQGTEGVDAEPTIEVELDEQGIVLYLLEQSKHTSLRWVNGDLVALA